jgi:tRNA-modifying protein YgfZ
MEQNNLQCLSEVLNDRALVRIGGADAETFLQGLFTCDLEDLEPGHAAFGALLTPQGKILFDFFLIRMADGYLADVASSIAADFVRRLNFYRLRARVEFSMVENTTVLACWQKRPETDGALCVADPRMAEMGWRLYGDAAPDCAAGDYLAHRVSLGMPSGGEDYAYGDTFPHEALMDQFRGVDFSKGCFVGQEVVSRMQHRGTARKRVVMASAETKLPAPGTEIRAGSTVLGQLGSVSQNHGLALVRLDRAAREIASGNAVRAGEIVLKLGLQSFVNYDWPQPAQSQSPSQA